MNSLLSIKIIEIILLLKQINIKVPKYIWIYIVKFIPNDMNIEMNFRAGILYDFIPSDNELLVAIYSGSDVSEELIYNNYKYWHAAFYLKPKLLQYIKPWLTEAFWRAYNNTDLMIKYNLPIPEKFYKKTNKTSKYNYIFSGYHCYITDMFNPLPQLDKEKNLFLKRCITSPYNAYLPVLFTNDFATIIHHL